MKTFKILLCFFAAAAIIFACQKEKSHEAGGGGTASDGSLQGAGSSCLGSTIGGVYQKDTTLKSTNYVDVQVLVNTPGTYLVYTDTVNGMWFRASGNFSTAGVQSVRLPGFGKPIAIGTNSFNVFYDSTQCTFSITTIAGVGAAAFTLTGQPNACSGAFSPPQGTYTAGVATNASNTVTVEVNVTTVGTYTITATGGGVTFSKTGVFTATGIQTVVLTASGTPPTAGTFPVPVVAGSSTCSFNLTINSASSAAVYTLVGNGSACSGAFSVQGTYIQNTALTTANTVTVQVNVTTIGSYSLTTGPAVNGVSFSASGTFTTTGLQTVVMAGTGTPSPNSGSIPYTVTGASTTCTFNLTVVAAVIDYFPRTTNSNWSYEVNDDPLDTLLGWVIPQTINAGSPSNPFNIFMAEYNSVVDSFGYYRKSGSDYYHWVNLADYLAFDNDQWVELNFIKDNQAVNFTWTSNSFSGLISTVPITVRVKWTITQQNGTTSLTTSTGTASYPNTIIIEERYQWLNGATWQDATSIFGYYVDYYSRNVGWIKEDIYDQTGAFSDQFELRRYQVY